MTSTNIGETAPAHNIKCATSSRQIFSTETADLQPRAAAGEGDAGRMIPTVTPRLKRSHDLFDELLEEWIAEVRSQADSMFGVMSADLDSDLERVFLAALMFLKPETVGMGYGGPLEITPILELVPQYKVGPYRIDFAVIVPGNGLCLEEIRIAIECDGAYFHDRTDKQAERDKRRDRMLTLNGWRVVRFSEAEIMKNPRSCADQVSQLIDALVNDQVKRAAAKLEGQK